jgi:hypothetical protein
MTYLIFTRNTPAPLPYGDGDWTAVDNSVPTTRLFLTKLTAAIAPAYSTCILEHHYGVISESGTRHIVAPINLINKYILVRLVDGASTQDHIFYCPKPQDTILGHHADSVVPATTRKPGVTTYTCYDLTWLLKRQPLDRALTTAGLIRTPLHFNIAARDRDTALTGNRSAAKTGAAPAESYVFDNPGTDTWTAFDVVEYIVRFANDYLGLNITFFGNSDLSNITDAFRGQGNMRDLLVRVISADRGYHWHMDGQTIRIDTFSSGDIDDGADVPLIVCPANANIGTLDLGTDPDMDPPTIEHIADAHYTHVEVRGEPIRMMTTLRGGEALEKGWLAEDESAYNAATAEQLERPDYANVWRRFILPSDWNGYRIPLSTTDNIWPEWLESAPHGLDLGAQQALYLGNLVFDRTLPIKDNDGGFRKPFCLIKDSDGYHLVHKKGTHLRMLDNAPGIYIETAHGHLLAGADYTGPSTDPATYDWDDPSTGIILTASYYTNEPLRILKAVASPPAGPNQIKIIHVPDHHYWYQAANTVTGFEKSALITSGPTILRDDSAALKRIANLAAVYYGQRRARISVRYRRAKLLDRLGHYIAEAGTGGSLEPSGTVVSRITYQWSESAITASLQTEFRDIDIEDILNIRGEPAKGPRSIGPRVSADPRNLALIESSPALGGAGGEPNPLTVSHDPATNQFTISVTALRWAIDNAGLISEDANANSAQGLFENVAWTFSEGYSEIEIGYIVTQEAGAWEHGLATYALKFTDSAATATDTTDLVVDDGTFHRLARVDLSDGAATDYTIEKDIRNPVVIRHQPPASVSWLHWDQDAALISAYNLSDTATSTPHTLAVPASTADNILYGLKRSGLNRVIGFASDTDWLGEPIVLAAIVTDSEGVMTSYTPYTERLHHTGIDAPIATVEIISHLAGEKTAEVKVWRGPYYLDATASPATVNTPDILSGATLHIVQLHDLDTLDVGRLYPARRIGYHLYETIPSTWQ